MTFEGSFQALERAGSISTAGSVAQEKTRSSCRLLVLVSEPLDDLEMERALQATKGFTVVVERTPPSTHLRGDGYDLVAIDVAAGAGLALSWGLDLVRDDPGAEVLFFAETPATPEVAAIRALGIKPVALGPGARDWLFAAAPALFRVARARREMRTAEAAVPQFREDAAPASHRSALPLPVAEGRFRESYLRAVLASAGNGRAPPSRPAFRIVPCARSSKHWISLEETRVARSAGRSRAAFLDARRSDSLVSVNFAAITCGPAGP